MADALHSCRFGTFLGDSARDRARLGTLLIPFYSLVVIVQ